MRMLPDIEKVLKYYNGGEEIFLDSIRIDKGDKYFRIVNCDDKSGEVKFLITEIDLIEKKFYTTPHNSIEESILYIERRSNKNG